MANITAAQVKELREATNVSMMECKRALVEAEGDLAKATKLLRERGMAVAAKKASRVANQGLIATAASDDGQQSLIEINCETDFVVRNETFQAFVKEMAERACTTDNSLSEECKDTFTAKIAEIGENIVAKSNVRYSLQGLGKIASYIHLGGKVGVLVELACEKEATTASPVFAELAKDLTLHIAAAAPQYLCPEEVPEDVVASEREIFAAQVKDKPENIIDQIVAGKIKKFYAEICLIQQGFVKEVKQSIQELLDEKNKELDDTVTIRRFVRYQIGA